MSDIDPNVADNFGRTPLHYAAASGGADCIRTLLEAGADPNARDYNGQTPLLIAGYVAEHLRQSSILANDGSPLGLLTSCGRRCWGELKAADKVALTYSEETITDNFCLTLLVADMPEVRVHKNNRKEESERGADYDLYIGNAKEGWWHYMVQAKRLDIAKQEYKSALHPGRKGEEYQFDALVKCAIEKQAIPLYAMYNYNDKANEQESWHCGRQYSSDELGWTVTSTCSIEPFIEKDRNKKHEDDSKKISKSNRLPTFDDLHHKAETLPIRCLLCTNVAHIKEASKHPLAGGNKQATRLPNLPDIVGLLADGNTDEFASQWIIVIETDEKQSYQICPGPREPMQTQEVMSLHTISTSSEQE